MAVGEAHKYFWALVKNWKLGNNTELRLCSENGRLKVNFSADLGVWNLPQVPDPPSTDTSRGHQGTRSAGPSRIRRRERRAAAREVKATRKTSEDLEASAADENTEEVIYVEEASSAEEVPAPKKVRSCSKCGGPSKGHSGPCGQKCSVVLPTPEKERCPSLSGDISLTLTPGQESRDEPWSFCGGMENITPEKVEPPDDEFYTLEVTCAKDVHNLWCCDIKNPSLNQKCPPVPAPPRVFHPNLEVFGYLSDEVSTPSCSTYLFKKGSQDILSECFKL